MSFRRPSNRQSEPSSPRRLSSGPSAQNNARPAPAPIGHGRVDLYLHQQGIDSDTPAGKAIYQMMGVFSEFERDDCRAWQIGEARVRGARESGSSDAR